MPKKNPSVVLSIRLDDQALRAVDLLVEAGLEANRSRAVSHFVNAGIGASEELLRRAQRLSNEVRELRGHMLESVGPNHLARLAALVNAERDDAASQAGGDPTDTATLVAAYMRANDIKELLINSGAEFSLFEAAAVGSTSRVRELLAASPELIASRNADGFPLLSIAAHFGNEETVRLLLELGADIHARSADGDLNNLAIHAAIMGSYTHIVTLLLDAGTDVDARCEGTQRRGYTALHVAAHFDRDALIRLFLSRGADKSARNADGLTPYELAVARGHAASAALLKP
ncbi:ankyrin repeat domain-containing protein [Cohnella sp. REN36]|uniref:ankyrin repeat domain-containing protein n=1 Tax=Cohnella sp. REN36 TaxID=2887347 RepID=UPI001D154B54|nr:ankyrin repeat domain-containing protein [Cohnella sp. REN36]MCC3373754.1 ankyrin repeat domain-containing protein [Cohnella sp. REN36]